MRVGLQVPSFTWPGAPGSIGPGLARIARTADEAGFASIWVMDHFFQIEIVGAAEEPMLEGYSAGLSGDRQMPPAPAWQGRAPPPRWGY